MSLFTAGAQTEVPKGRPVAAELQRFKDAGAVIVSSDNELVALAKQYIDFGKIYLPNEVDTTGFKGLYISEYTTEGASSRGYTYGGGWASRGSDFFLVSTTKPAKPGVKGETVRTSAASVGVPVSNTLREKLPLYLIVFNNLLHLSYQADLDISVAPKEPSMEQVIGAKVKELKTLKLLVMEHELHKSLVAHPEKIAGAYPYPYEVGDLFTIPRAVKEKQPGTAAIFVSASSAFWAVYVIRCDTHELLYAWSKRMTGKELSLTDFSALAATIAK